MPSVFGNLGGSLHGLAEKQGTEEEEGHAGRGLCRVWWRIWAFPLKEMGTISSSRERWPWEALTKKRGALTWCSRVAHGPCEEGQGVEGKAQASDNETKQPVAWNCADCGLIWR